MFLVLSGEAFARQFNFVNHYTVAQHHDHELDHEGEEEEPYTESKARRSEIVFLLAFPFVVLSNVLIVGTAYFAATKDSTFEMPPEALAFIAASSLITTIVVTYDDYTKAWPDKPVSEKKGARVRMAYHYRF